MRHCGLVFHGFDIIIVLERKVFIDSLFEFLLDGTED